MQWPAKMSKLIGMSEESCGIYHQNYLQRFKSIDGIINYLKVVVFYKHQFLPK